MSRQRRTRKRSGRGTLNLLIYGLIVLAVSLSGLAAWQRYAQVPRFDLGDTVEQRTDAFLPNLGLIENWTQAGGLPQGVAAAPNCSFVCPQCQSSVWTHGRGVSPLCPFCSVAMARWGLDQQAPVQQDARASLVGGAGTTNQTFPIPIQANAVCPHADRGACTNCHNVVKSSVASSGGTAAAAQGSPKELWRGAAAPAIAANAVKPSLIKEFGIEVIAVPGGVKVTGVMGNSFASRAGATAGDIIIGCNGAKVRDLVQFQQAVSAMVPESNAKIKILRNGRTRDLSIMVGEGEMEAFLPIQRP